MITVFVGEKDAIQGIRFDPDPAEAQDQLLGGKPGIHQQAGASGLNNRRVSTTTTAQNRETHGGRVEWSNRVLKAESSAP
jgi:hypothetical protein